MNGNIVLIGVLIAIALAVLVILVANTNRAAKVHHQLEGLSAKIDQPVNNASLRRSIPCSGSVRGVSQAPEASYYLAVETEGLIWPKEPPLSIGPDGRWAATLREDGWPERFSITLWAVPPSGVQHIHIWLDNGRRTGNYPVLTVLPDAHRLAEVCGLRIEQGL